jgi:hypothetical protein
LFLLIEKRANNMSSGTIYILRDIDTENEKLEKAVILNYPKDVVIHAHGLGLYKSEDLLYVVNHAYSKGVSLISPSPFPLPLIKIIRNEVRTDSLLR